MSGSDNTSVTQPTLLLADNLVYSVPASVGLGLVLGLVCLLTILCNMVTVYVFLTDRQLTTFSDRLILNLAVADTLVGTAPTVVQIVLTLTGDTWLWGHRGCLLYLCVALWFNYSSVGNTLVASLDHYLHVRNGAAYERKKTSRLLAVMVLSPWLVVFVLFALPVAVWDPVTNFQGDVVVQAVCTLPFAKEASLTVHVLLSPFLPIIAIPVLDVLIYINIRAKYGRNVTAERVRRPVEEDSTANALSGVAAPGVEEDLFQLSLQSPTGRRETQDTPGQRPSSFLPPQQTRFISGDRNANAEDEKPSPVEPGAAEDTSGAAAEDSSAAASRSSSDIGEREGEGERGLTGGVRNAATEYSEDLKSARLYLMLGMVLVITCTPFELLKLFSELCALFQGPACFLHISNPALQAAHWVVIINSSINPVLYYYFDQRYHDAYLRLFRRVACCLKR